MRTPLHLLCLFALCACGAQEETPRTNVILITLDTTRADYFGCYGNSDGLTPNFDRTAREGALFELALATSAVTPVSHASILTGLDPYHHGLRVLSAASGFRLSPEVPTLATRLKEAGWRTGAIHSAFPVSAHFGLERGYDEFQSLEAEIDTSAEGETERHSWPVASHQRRSDETTARAISFLKKGDEPFFLWLHYWDPHDPWQLPPEDFLAGLPPAVLARSKEFEGRYAAEVAYLDHSYGRLIRSLEEAGLDDQTLIVITSDHGEGLGEHDWKRHRILYQEQIHVPLILRGPGVRPVRSEALASTIDVLPTVLDYLGLDSGAVDGRSLRGAIDGERLPERTVYADQINGYDLNARLVEKRARADFLYCVSDGRWKLIYRPNHVHASELFDLDADPDEAVNLYAENAEVRVRLLTELASRRPFVTEPFEADGEHGLGNAGALEALESLGYAGGGSAGADYLWEWTCPLHEDETHGASGRCSACERDLLPRRAR